MILKANVDETVKQLEARGISVVGAAANVGKTADVKQIIELAVATYGRIDVVVSNAAVNPFTGSILDTPEWAVDKLFDVNVKSVISLLQEAKPHMSSVSSCTLILSPHGDTSSLCRLARNVTSIAPKMTTTAFESTLI